MTQLSENLRKLFEASKRKPAEVSRETGIPAPRISEILTEKTKNPTIDTLFRIVSALNGSLDFVTTGEGEMFLSAAGQGEIDVDVLRDVIAGIEAHLKRNRGNLPPAKKAELITLVYEDTMESENKTVDLKSIKKLVSLAT